MVFTAMGPRAAIRECLVEIGQMKRDLISMSRPQLVAQLERWERLLGYSLGERSTGEIVIQTVAPGAPGDPGDE